VGLVVGIDRFMSEARALTNFTGNAIATVVLARAVGELDSGQARAVLAGDLPFDEEAFAAGDEHAFEAVAPTDAGSSADEVEPYPGEQGETAPTLVKSSG
jgi:aerobic C4-dicarboxylate transport protein